MSITADAATMKAILGLQAEPVAVFLLAGGATPPFAPWESLPAHRYCQALMRARRGSSVLLRPEELACPAAATAFGWRPLPENLANGRGLVGFGIVDHPETGRTMFDGMARLAPGAVSVIALCPLAAAPRLPEVVVVEDQPERLMWLLLADLNLAGGGRRQASTAVLQATCVDATVIPHLEQRLNFSLGCYGCREATDLGSTEAVLGFPGALLAPLCASLATLGEKAIPRSRAKAVYANLAAKGDPR
jgi:uncharacterized protein (DUF169 family)